ncbi:MAG: type II toxin-antitoxin system RelE/ParE family toxin [Candidatus Micrarchaeota archaeon]
MPFSAEYSQQALFTLKKLERATAERIILKMGSVASNPRHFLRQLEGGKLFKARVGDYRVIVRVDEAGKKIFIVEIGHRKNVYKK